MVVDAHTADHLYQHCLKGELMQGRTVILVSHHVQLCAPGASYIVALDNGRVSFAGDAEGFKASGVQATLVQSEHTDDNTVQDSKEEKAIEEEQLSKPASVTSSAAAVAEEVEAEADSLVSETSSTIAVSSAAASTLGADKKKPRKLIEEEKRAVGRIGRDIWEWYFAAVGGWAYWVPFVLSVTLGALCPVAENGWLRCVSLSVLFCLVFSFLSFFALYVLIELPCAVIGRAQVSAMERRGARRSILLSMLWYVFPFPHFQPSGVHFWRVDHFRRYVEEVDSVPRFEFDLFAQA